MATKKATSAKKTSGAKPAPTKSPTTTKITTIKADAKSSNGASVTGAAKSGKGLPDNLIPIVFVEMLGTFALTLVAVLTLSSFAPLFLGLALIALFMAVGAVSGGHLNPAVTFGLWASRRIIIMQAVFYWIAQFIGAMAAVVALNWISNGAFGVTYDSFTTLSLPVMAAELIGAAVFMYGFMAARNYVKASTISKAVGVGLSFMLGLLVASSLLTAAQSAVDQSKIDSVEKVPHELRVKSPILNPAVSLAATENTNTQLQGGSATREEKKQSRFTLEVILGSFIGAAIGANLYLLSTYRERTRR